jgi:hypothetical protein
MLAEERDIASPVEMGVLQQLCMIKWGRLDGFGNSQKQSQAKCRTLLQGLLECALSTLLNSGATGQLPWGEQTLRGCRLQCRSLKVSSGLSLSFAIYEGRPRDVIK